MTYMATIDELVANGTLIPMGIRLNYPDVENRKLYAVPAVRDWFEATLPALEQFEPTDISPRLQARGLFRMYQSGERLEEGEEFKLMQPQDNDVYELRTADLRIFGWFYRPAIFIATAADTMENVHSQSGLSSRHRDEVIRVRGTIGLDPPSHIQGASTEHVLFFGA
ncbi:hypothetical protein [Rhizobium laguerreae]|uniref:hypothetical protein n=1 Tax=Rhizobium laguerreae TaxID=1076926 RepID=UPI001C916BA3|nr:hypothetical protein [Rhizobium laguerreae]MBY3136289.1 hypothetical protein [Rhizobium laguerreae]